MTQENNGLQESFLSIKSVSTNTSNIADRKEESSDKHFFRQAPLRQGLSLKFNTKKHEHLPSANCIMKICH